ncbi:alpha/beta hydrolase family protein [Bacillus sp. GB_SG_008]|uniref:alpha/beta hydrolase family protein n=1 Tax=Bacillus sp. GB_SG_008 TaxID=3454627 RepID=UPI003F82F08C
MDLKSGISEIIGIKADDIPASIEYRIIESIKEDGYKRHLIEYNSNGDTVIAFLLIPEVLNNNPAILINHQHNSEHHLGKSEACGLAGNPLQAFGPELARKGFVVLAPDSICFEERRKNAQGIVPLPGDEDFFQHLNEMSYRILKGDNLMKKVMFDAMNGVTLLSELTFTDNKKIGTLGHSYGGNTVLFLSALDERICFSCASGSACTYENRMLNDVGIELASVIPRFNKSYDIFDLVHCIAPRPLLIVSANEDKYSRDADFIVEQARPSYAKYGADNKLCHKRYNGGHGLTKERFDYIVEWLCMSAGYTAL